MNLFDALRKSLGPEAKAKGAPKKLAAEPAARKGLRLVKGAKRKTA